MNWYKEAQLKKTASITFYIKGYDYPRPMETILDLCYHVAYGLHELNLPIGFQGVEPDGDSWNQATGTINLYVNDETRKNPAKYVDAVNSILKEANCEVGAIIFNTFKDYKAQKMKERDENRLLGSSPEDFYKSVEEDPRYESDELRVIRFPVVRNRNLDEERDEPPEINMSNGNARAVLRPLGFSTDDLISVSELVSKIDQFLSERVGEFDNVPATQDNDPFEGFRNFGLPPDYIIERFQQLRELGEWAQEHGYHQIYGV